MNQEQKSKTAVIKTLAIIGFLATTLVGVWVLVQVARFTPEAFSSLASIIESLEEERPRTELTVLTEKSIVNAGETFRISWTDLRRDGTYYFTYTCTEGVSMTLQSHGTDISSTRCDTTIALPPEATELDVIASSEKRRFIDVPFTLTFANTEGETQFERNAKVTVVNATIPASADIFADIREDAETVAEDQEEHTEEETNTDASTPTAEVRAPRSTENVVSFIPQSYEDGFTDLKISYLGIGTLENDVFVPQSTLDVGDRGAVKFEVKNIGTKTSEDWTFTTTLPDGYVFASSEQAPLKPNERAEFTLGFTVNDEPGNATITGTAEVPDDSNTRNDSFSWSVKVTD